MPAIKSPAKFLTGLFATLAVAWWANAADGPGKPKPKRAAPPAWNDRSKSAFFDDASKALVGERPKYGTGGGARSVATNDAPADTASAGGGYAWSKIIAPEAIEDEVKTIAKGVTETVVNPQQYAGGGYKMGQDHFSMLATLFAVIAEYDGEVRWKKNAIAAREEFATASFGSRVGSIQAFNQAKLARDDLANLISGQPLAAKEADAKAQWAKVSYRPPLMRRLKIAQEERLNGWTASAGEFKKNQERILHEAQILAMLSDVIARDGYEFADDSTYGEYCQTLKKAALDVVDAAKQNNADAARTAMGVVGKTCNACHEGFRS